MKFRNLFVTLILILPAFMYSQAVVTIDSLRYNDANGVPIGMGQYFTTTGIVTSGNQFVSIL